MVAVLVGMVAVVRIAADHHPAVRMMVAVVVVMRATASAGRAVSVDVVHRSLGMPAGTFGPADGGRHGHRITALLAVVMMVAGTGRCRGRGPHLGMSTAARRGHRITVGATAGGMWRAGSAVADLLESLDTRMLENSAQVHTAGSGRGGGGHWGGHLVLLARISTHNGDASRLPSGQLLQLK